MQPREEEEMNFEMRRHITVTINDYNRLMGLIAFASLKVKMPDIANRLEDSLLEAKTLSQDTIDEGIITMNSRVRLKDLNNQWETEITLTYRRMRNPVNERYRSSRRSGLPYSAGRKRKSCRGKSLAE